MISVIIVFFALMYKFLFQGNSSKLSQIINMIIDGYVGIINFIFGVLFDILHSFISVIPSYKMFVYHNSSLSSMAVIALLAIISNFILITLIKKNCSNVEKRLKIVFFKKLFTNVKLDDIINGHWCDGDILKRLKRRPC